MKAIVILVLLCLNPVWARTGQSNLKGEPVAIVTNQKYPAAIAVDEEYVYWVSDSGQTIKRVKKIGGEPVTIATGKTISQIMLDEDSLFFVVLGEIRTVRKTGGPVATLVKSSLIGYSRVQMTVDQTNFYYYEEVPVPPGKVDKNPLLRKVNKHGGEPVTLNSGTYQPVGLATDGAHVYWGDNLYGVVKSISVNGGRPVTVGRCRRGDVIADAKDFYCSSREGLFRFNKSIYVVSSYMGTYGIYRISARSPELIVPLKLELRDFAVDDTAVYWTDATSGTVMRLPK